MPAAGTGRAGTKRRRPSLGERLKAKLVPRGECLVWTGAQNGREYGQISLDGKKLLVHRVAWELRWGPIPPERQVDHVCHNTLCCNTDHLRLATAQENLRHKAGARKNNLSGLRGVSTLASGRFRAKVTFHGLAYGHSWDTAEEAAEEAALLRAAFYGDYAGGD